MLNNHDFVRVEKLSFTLTPDMFSCVSGPSHATSEISSSTHGLLKKTKQTKIKIAEIAENLLNSL